MSRRSGRSTSNGPRRGSIRPFILCTPTPKTRATLHRGGQRTATRQWLALRQRFLTLLDDQARLERMARIIGKDSLPPRQRLTLLCADIVNEAFLRQSAFSEIDRVCGPSRQAAMMRLIGLFIDRADASAEAGIDPERISRMACVRSLQRMGEEIGDDDLPRFGDVEKAMESEFAGLAKATEGPDASHG